MSGCEGVQSIAGVTPAYMYMHELCGVRWQSDLPVPNALRKLAAVQARALPCGVVGIRDLQRRQLGRAAAAQRAVQRLQLRQEHTLPRPAQVGA